MASIDESRCLRLASLCSEWGGGLHVMPRHLWRDDLASMDFMYPVAHDWPSCHVFIDRYEAWPYAIHEMSHCFAMTQPAHLAGPTEPPGWNFLLACRLDVDAGRDWVSFFRRNGLNVGRDFREMSDADVSAYLAWTVARERDLGLLDGITPVPVRRGPGLRPLPPRASHVVLQEVRAPYEIFVSNAYDAA